MSERDFVICQECGQQLPNYAVKHSIEDCLAHHIKRVKEIPGEDISALRAQLEQAQERVRWIPVSESLPVKSGHYLCWYQDGFGNKGPWVGYWDESRKGFYPKWPNNPSRGEKYWMPLPTPPEGVEPE